jgi:peptidoglycan-N-acetylglucosamine deacetylase
MKRLRNALIGLGLCLFLLVAGVHLLPAVLKWANPGITYRVPGVGKTLFITIDDGPSEGTHLILDVLKKHQVPATFFVITDHINSDIMNRIVVEGHPIGHHMRSTASIGNMPLNRFQSEFMAADHALSTYPHSRLFRPPNGTIPSEKAAFVTAQGYQIVVGTIFPLDHVIENEKAISELAKLLITDGGIIILHDTRTRAPRTAIVLNELIPYLKQKGYTFARLPSKEP